MKTKISFYAIGILIIMLVVISCKKNSLESDDNYSSTPVVSDIPDNYDASTNDQLATLGRVLFYDKSLSLNNSVSCASCHQQQRAFCDNQQFSTGLESAKTRRNSPSIFAKNSSMFWDGRAATLKSLVLRPIQNHVEMRFERIQDMVDKVSKISYYPQLFAKAFPGTSKIDSNKIQLALTEFLKNFNFSNNRFSQSREGLATLNASEKIGELVFFNKGKCSNCHHIESQNIVFPFDSLKGNIGGGYGSTEQSHNIGLDLVYADNGVGGITKNQFQNGSFMVPVLLNVELTAPYMHDGRFKTLEEVVEHYNSGIQNNRNLDFNLRDLGKFDPKMDGQILSAFDKNRDGEIDGDEIANIQPVKLGLTSIEKKGLVDFLKTLTDFNILRDPRFSSPFVQK